MLRFDRFYRLHPSHRQLTLDLLHAAEDGPSFFRFALLWMSFNGWLACVSGETHDGRMVAQAAAEPRLIQTFSGLLASSRSFRTDVEEFSTWWPVFDPRTARRFLGADMYDWGDRDEFKGRAYPDVRIRRSPDAWLEGQTVRWPDLISVIYRIRCNLFHGEKSPASAADDALVDFSFRTLHRFVTRTNLYEWHD